MPSITILLIFFSIALVYASVGLGGGSAYTAVLFLMGVHFELIPTTSLALNAVVSSIGTITYLNKGQLKLNRIWPYLILSVPMAYIGGALVLPRTLFLWLLMLTLIAVAGRIYIYKGSDQQVLGETPYRVPIALGVGAILGFISGTVGIGGGIFLVPIIIAFRLGPQDEAIAAGSAFVFINSLAGLISRYQRGAFDFDLLLPLALSVIIGGAVGAYLSAYRWEPRTVQRVLGMVILIAITSIGKQIL